MLESYMQRQINWAHHVTEDIRNALATKQVAETNIDAEVSQTVRGFYRGETIVALPLSELSLMESAQEELSFAVADQMGKGLMKRKFGPETRIRSHTLEQANNYLKRVPDIEKQQQLSEFVEQLKRNPQQTVSQLVTMARQFSEDPTLQYAALAYAMGMVSKGGKTKASRLSQPHLDDTQLADSIETAMTELMKADGPAITAGLNVSAVAHGAASTQLGNTQALRGFYRDAVLDYGNVTQTYQKIINKYGEKGFEQALNFLLRALAADIYAQGSSIEPRRLKAINDDMFAIKVIGALHEVTNDLIERLKHYQKQRQCREGQILMGELLALKDQSLPRAKTFYSLANKMKISGTTGTIYFLQETKKVLRQIPDKAYDGDFSKKNKLLSALQEAIDSAILAEDGES